MSSSESSLSNLISISDSLDDSCKLTLRLFQDLLFFVPKRSFTVGEAVGSFAPIALYCFA
jgi:hypothetical protein